MTNRFDQKHEKKSIRLLITTLPTLAFIGLLILVLQAMNQVSSTTISKQQESLENALTRSIAQCYAIEGRYPSSINYLEEHYGLTYNDELFFVDYTNYGSNLYPEVTVIKRSGKRIME